MFKTTVLLSLCVLGLTACSESSSPSDNYVPNVNASPLTRAPQVFSAKDGQLPSTTGKVEGDMVLTESGDLYAAQNSGGTLVWVKKDSLKTTTPGQKGDRGSKISVNQLASESTTDKLSGDLLIDSLTADVYLFDGSSFVATGLNIRGLKGDKGDKGDTGAQGAAGTNGINGATGATGATGAAGVNGTNGTNGTSCSVSKSGTTTTISCTDGTSSTVVDGKDGVNGTNGSNGSGSTPASLLNKGYIILKASRDPQGNTTSPVNFNSDATRTLVLPDSLQVTYGNAGNATARICVNGNCCIYKGGADIESPLNPGYLNQWNTSTSRSDLVQIEKGRQYRFQSCSTGNRTVTIQQYQNLYIGVDYGDPSMITEITATIEVK